MALVWLVAIPFALLVGFAIAGSPFVDEDVPLRDRGVEAHQVATDPPATTTTEPGG
ncbi:hypothetical protein KSP35_09255 [Aquihabitans sp. G128]|uniref:hypothetical protein n=1 Tax=Aquihabitans sp. G128 TaxID=2849779 RepID=UPI001C2166A6|nr:hypothetical protein [Aquihabitans sp. G128]QXC62945.1 hypothetical protein KSP35_09255 [Aquihabitans sp. G128]